MDDAFDGFEWDEEKSALNEERRGFAFDIAAQVFRGDYIETESRSRDFGEPRSIAIGNVDGLIITVIWTPRGVKRRIISARPSSRKERDIYRGYRDEETF